jgi:transcriptional regulator with XRE-family HTH domain
MADDMGSTVPRRQLGRALKELRVEAQMTLDAVAEALHCSRQKMWRIEAGLGPVRPLDVRFICELYGATRELSDALTNLAAETKAKGWWHSYGNAVPDWFELYVGIEQAASSIRRFDEALIPGMLQSRAYAYAVYQHRRDMTEDKRERLIEVRLQRQALLHRRLPAAPNLEVILAEAALLRTVGSAATMADQLRHLLKVEVLPLSAGLHFGAVAGTFVILDFPIRNRVEPEPSVIYSESLTGALYLDRKEELAVYEEHPHFLPRRLDPLRPLHQVHAIVGPHVDGNASDALQARSHIRTAGSLNVGLLGPVEECPSVSPRLNIGWFDPGVLTMRVSRPGSTDPRHECPMTLDEPQACGQTRLVQQSPSPRG